MLPRNQDVPEPASMSREALHHLTMFLWVARGAARQFGPQIARIVILDLASLLGAVAVIAGFTQLLRALESGSDFVLGPAVISLDMGVPAILGISAGFTVLGAVSALSHYAARRRSARVAGAYLHGLRSRLLQIVSEPAYRGWESLLSGATRKSIQLLAGKSAAMTSLALWALLQTLLPIGILLFVGPVLLITEPLLSILLTPLLFLYLLSLFFAYRGVADNRRRYVEVSQLALSGIRDTLGTVAASEHPSERAISAAAGQLSAPEHFESIELFFELRLAVQRVRLINGVFSVLCFATVLAFIAPLVNVAEGAWTDLLLYLVVLRFALDAVKKATGSFTMVSRRLPEIESISEFFDAADRIGTDQPPGSSQDGTDPSEPKNLSLAGDS